MSPRVWPACRPPVMGSGIAALLILIVVRLAIVRGWSNDDGGAHEAIAREALRLLEVPLPAELRSQVPYGAKLEDSPDPGELLPTRHHGYNPITNRPFDVPDWFLLAGDERFDEETAAFHASLLWTDMLVAFRIGDRVPAFEYLGRVSHLLQDVAQPGHSHAPRGHGNFDTTYPYWAVSDLERYWRYWSGTVTDTLTPVSAFPSSPTWGSKMRQADWEQCETSIFVLPHEPMRPRLHASHGG